MSRLLFGLAKLLHRIPYHVDLISQEYRLLEIVANKGNFTFRDNRAVILCGQNGHAAALMQLPEEWMNRKNANSRKSMLFIKVILGILQG